MRTFLARCTMLGLIAGGFALTGDGGWIVRRVRSLLDATTVPGVAGLWGEAASAGAPVPAEQQPMPPGPTVMPAAPAAPVAPPVSQVPPTGPANATGLQPAPVEVHVAPSLAAPAEMPPADGGPASVDLRLLRPGQRVRVWSGGTTVTFDIVDPASGEAIQHHPTRRVRLGGGASGHRIDRGGMLVVQPRAGIGGHEPPAERIGPVRAVGL